MWMSVSFYVHQPATEEEIELKKFRVSYKCGFENSFSIL